MIFAIDFDGTIFSEAWPEIGEPVREVVKFIRELQERGDLWILYTMREGATLEQAVAALAELGLRPDAINDNRNGAPDSATIREKSMRTFTSMTTMPEG